MKFLICSNISKVDTVLDFFSGRLIVGDFCPLISEIVKNKNFESLKVGESRRLYLKKWWIPLILSFPNTAKNPFTSKIEVRKSVILGRLTKCLSTCFQIFTENFDFGPKDDDLIL